MQSSATHSGQSHMQPLSFGSARFATFGFASFLIHCTGGLLVTLPASYAALRFSMRVASSSGQPRARRSVTTFRPSVVSISLPARAAFENCLGGKNGMVILLFDFFCRVTASLIIAGQNLATDYESFCEELWRSWLDETLELSPFLRAEFDVGSAPEPWLPFDAGAVPLVALTTNPGASMPHQHRDAIRSGRSVIDRASSYLMAAEALARFYATVLSGPARWRIRSLARLAALAGYEGVLQVESCPFHSARLPNKRALVRANKGDGVLGTYVGHLQHFLAGRPVVTVSAVSSRTPLSPDRFRLSEWLAWQATLMGLEPHRAAFVPLVTKGDATTAAALVSSVRGAPKALVLMMGGNHLPAEAGLGTLANALRAAAASKNLSPGKLLGQTHEDG